ncbi:xanthine dehydrogenase family protein molybdopterin-binding subunit [Desulfitibacter alkalitolerans]|uniref:xanthine dehydrogenase family protein molybdopterin-binding subunit n=1 Tax=Desulfitibacter alkalitolerans TaxID=264641 RepID=UPI00047F5663|nr:xanthine dehydrogenase family protein molybdopterin-binding subunit [Desulfitibacter alkalitolerans]
MGSFIGKPIARIDAEDKVTGKGHYAADIKVKDCLWIKLVRSPIPHGIIKSINTSELKNKPGVFCFTGQDIKVNSFGNIIKDQPILAHDKVRFYGEPVVLVAAPTKKEAEFWAGRVYIEYESLPVMDDPMVALKNEVKIHDQGNLLQKFNFDKRDVNKGFGSSHLTLKDEFEVPMVDHAYLETEAGVSYWDGDVLNVIAGTQNPFHDRNEIARCFDISPDRIRVKAPLVGGGFGGKDGNTVQLYLALVTIKTGKPAKLVFDREESLLTTYKRHPARVVTKMGFGKHGRILAFESEIYFDTGAYAALGPAVLGLGVEHSTGPYEIANVKIDAYLVYTNKPPASAMRGFGAPQTLFATETLINRAAELLEIDPIQIRLLNSLEKGKEASLGQVMEHSVGIKEALKKLGNSDFWRKRKQEADPLVGYGMASGWLSCGLGVGIKDDAKVEIRRSDDKYIIKVGCVDIGQGNYTGFAQLAASELQVDMDKIELVTADTLGTHDCGTTAASRTTYIVGNALLNAIKDYRKQEEKGIAQPVGIGQAVFPESKLTHLGIGLPHMMYTFIAQAAKVRIDPYTGEIKLLYIFGVTEAGKVLNPLSLSGQIEGGIAMNAGYCLMEQMRIKDGIPLERDLSKYLIPTSMDLCNMETATVDAYENSGPFGIKGAAEVSTVAIAPAITAAVAGITGKVITKLPISRHNIVEACMEGYSS